MRPSGTQRPVNRRRPPRNQARKETIDRIGGSGVYGRDPDTIITLTKHKEEQARALTVDLILRNFPEPESFVIAWDFPLMTLRDDLDPDDLKQARGRKPTHEPADLLEVMDKDCLTTTEWKARANDAGISSASFYRILKEIRKSGRVVLVKNKKWESKPVVISFAKENISPVTDSSSPIAGALLPAIGNKPSATNEKQPAEPSPPAAKNEWKFMREPHQRSRLALLFRLMEELGGQEMKEQFKRDVLPRLKLSENAFSELSEEEFEHGLMMMKKELPAYKQWLLQNPSGAFL